MPADPAADSAAGADTPRRVGALRGGLLTGGLLALVFAPPFASPPLRAALGTAFTFVCHRLPERSFHLHGVALGVCHRCTGVVAGLLAGAVAYALLGPRADAALGRHAGAVLALALGPLALDWALGAAGLWANTPLSRTLTGALFGAAAGLLLARSLAPTPRRMAAASFAPDAP